ncbi:MAG: ATP-binding cassette domain-containing protein [Pseudomonadota bacterium]
MQNLQFAYPERQLFSKLTASLPAGVNLIRGGDGRGKSTLLRLLAGVLHADGGSMQINQTSLKEQPNAYRQQVFWTEARSENFDQLTPPAYFEMQRQRWPGFDSQRLGELIQGLDLEVHLHKQLFMLSTGSKRKVWLAGAFASGAAVTLIDEPFAALDAPSIRFVIQLLKDSAAQQQRVFVVADYEAPGDVPLAGLIDLGD